MSLAASGRSLPFGIRERVPLAPFCTLEVGGPARYFADATQEAHLAEVLAWARAGSLPVVVIGGGSNLLVSDRGVDGLVIRVRISGIAERSRVNNRVHLEVGAGEVLDDVVARAVGHDWAGLECLSGIPGLVGATPIQNVGAYGQEVSDTIVEVRAVDRATGASRVFDAPSCGFRYRSSVFKAELADRYVVTSVTFALQPRGAPTVRYPELARQLGATPSLSEVRAAVIAIRRTKSMVIAADDPNRRSAGSFFVNPTVSVEDADEVERRANGAGAMPRFSAGPGRVKLSAAWLIERAGMSKGFGEGPVGLSTRHTLAIVNRGSATSRDVILFATEVRRRVLDCFGVTLQQEPALVGFAEEE